MSSSDDEAFEPQPSTSTSRARPTKRTRRTVMTPSPINSGSSTESEAKTDDPSKGQAVKQTKRIKMNSPAGTRSKKRSHSGVDGNSTASNKRKKASTSMENDDKDQESTTDDENSANKSAFIAPTPKRTVRKKKKVPTTRSQPGPQKVFKTPSARPRSRTQSGGRNRSVSPTPSIQSLGSQSLFSQARLTSHPGVIKSLHLTNFMCHSNFVHTFHPNLNFITGQNGSGKSALLSGILIALGGKATVTSRTNSLKALIQKGKNTCRVAVTLLNENGLSRYGDEITIERWVNLSGSGGYRIKSTDSEDGERSSTWRQLKKPELDRILLGLNIQIDNPVAVLNQEVARSFLRSKDPKVKFNLFYDGTLLSKLETVIKDTKEELTETGAILDLQKQHLTNVRGEIITLRQKCEKIAELDHIKEKLTEVHGEYLWSIVIEQEKSVKESKRAIGVLKNDIELLSKRLDQLKVNYAQTNEESILREQTEVRDQLAEKEQELSRNRALMNETKKKYVMTKTKLKTIGQTVQNKENQIKKLSTSLENEKAKQATRAMEETNQDVEILNNLKSKKSQLESVITSLKSDADNFQQAADQEREQLQDVDNRVRHLRTQIEFKKKTVTTLTSRNANKYSAFGPKMEQLVAKVQANAHRFKKPPKGPLGSCFRVKDPKYAPVIESVLWNFLDSFIVGDARDLNLLRELVAGVYNERDRSQSRKISIHPGGKTPGIHCMRYSEQMYDITRHHASHPNAPSIVDLIEIENDDHIVMNALIDVAEIEKQIVFPDNSSAAQVLKHESSAPKSLKSAYTLNWFRFTPAPRYAARVMKMKSRAEYLKSGRSKEMEIAALRSEIKALEQEIKNLDPTKAEIRRKEQSLRERFDEKSKEVNDMRRKLGEVINDAKRHESNMKGKEKQRDFTSWEEELQDLRDELSKELADRDVATKSLEPLQTKVTEYENTKAGLDQEIQELTTKLNSFEESRDKLNSRRIELDNVLKKVKEKMAKLETDKSKITDELESKGSELNDRMELASKDCPRRVDTKRSPADVKREFEGIKVRIAETEARLGNIDELKAALIERQDRFLALKREYVPLANMLKIVRHTNLDQHASFEKMKAHMGRTLTYFFSSMAKQRGYEGRLLVDFETKELYYFVCPDGDSSSKTLKAIDAQEIDKQNGPRSADQLKQSKVLKKALVEYSLGLSGGERSFATICFIMALWQVMECPFYMLDEFDVFMDAFNRKTSQLALMAHAKRFCQNQFVLFTPLDLGELPSPDDACVLRLFPPVRTGRGDGDGSADAEPQSNGTGETSPPQGGSLSSQGTSSNGTRRRADGSPSDSTENIDPRGPVSQPKGNSKGKGKQRRQAAGSIMSLVES